MSERIPCSNPDCRNTILPSTAAANNGLCAPCIGDIRKKEREEYIRLNRRTVDQYEGIADRVEIAVIMLSPRKYDPLIAYAPAPLSVEQLFASLSAEDACQLAAIASRAMEDGNVNLAEDIGKSLATLTDWDLTEMLHAWLAKHHYWPSITFRMAKHEIRDAIIQSLTAGRANANHALSSLAWIGDDVVKNAFVQWDIQRPTWASSLHVIPSAYAHTAGWEIVNNSRRDLFHEHCLALTQADDGHSVAMVRTFQGTGRPCPWCGHELSHMLEIDLSDRAFAFLSFAGSRLPILTCHGCTCYGGAFFSKVEPDGTAQPHPRGIRPKWLPDTSQPWSEPAWRNIGVKLTPRRAIHAADWCMELKTSQIGGLPCWVQDSDYPQCPDCDKSMTFIAQLNEDDFPACEGTYYAFLCASCRTTATNYQQT
ncbi:MAG: hypothetical protein ABL974_00015 [Prosthecobacter sp.]